MPIPPGNKFYEALAIRESRNNPTIVNEFGFMGLYQMGPAALKDTGYMSSRGTWTGKNGINSQADFLSSRSVQDVAIREYHVKLWSYIPSDVKAAVGRRIGGVDVTSSGLLAAAHLRGQDGVARFIRSGGRDDDRDEIGTPCSEYMRQFGGYD
ncbi:uncharacterized protein LOC110858908 [Folsomia candida]|uniref:uncharacterized protein LOC110858908 n=1 Tax=Folsomia candida TaxID=158441 RepID=UPI000B900874|nr:uncharacterized protein LOC110858908 [Folsomia candida]